MRPRNKDERKVIALSKKLNNITKKHEDYAYEHCFKSYAFRSKKVNGCFKCGHIWKEDNQNLISTLLGITCPACGSHLEVRKTKHKSITEHAYFSIVTTAKEYQVIRNFFVSMFCKLGKPAEYRIDEVAQNWFTADFKQLHYIGKLAQTLGARYIDQWILSSDLEIRNIHERYMIQPEAVYPFGRTLSAVRRNGFKGKYYEIGPYYLFKAILRYPMAETLLKAKQISLLELYCFQDYKVSKHWPSIKICIRNNYNVSDAGIWSDYIDLLKWMRKDELNPKYVCPKNLKQAHDELQEKKRRVIEQRDRVRLIEKHRKDEEQLFQKKVFFDLQLTDGEIKIVVLDSIDEFKKEGDILQHCVYTNAYYEKPDSLIMSARKDDQRLETIELSLENYKVIQSRGIRNENTEYHDRILNLVKSNIKLIANRKKQLTHADN